MWKITAIFEWFIDFVNLILTPSTQSSPVSFAFTGQLVFQGTNNTVIESFHKNVQTFKQEMLILWQLKFLHEHIKDKWNLLFHQRLSPKPLQTWDP